MNFAVHGFDADNGYGLKYDPNGNILGLVNHGFKLGNSTGYIDALRYTYIANTNRLAYVADDYSDPNTILGDFHDGANTLGTNDYTGDKNGNRIVDNNKNISSITYYPDLNLPNTMTVTNKGTIQYTYDAAGNKLQKKVIETSATVNGYVTKITTTTKYINGFVYQDVQYDNVNLTALNTLPDVLQFLSYDEGRLRFKPESGTILGSFVYDYFLNDNIDNVRMVLTDEAHQNMYPAATLESVTYNGGIAQSEEARYYNIKAANVLPVATSPKLSAWWASATGHNYLNNNTSPVNPNPYSDQTTNSANVYWLNGQTGDKTGLGITLKVMAGDNVSIAGKSIWHNTGTAASYIPVSSTLLDFFGAFANSAAVGGASHGIITASGLNAATDVTSLVTPLLNNAPNQSTNTTYAPKAGINWILFDDQFHAVAMDTRLVSSSPDVVYSHSFPLAIPMLKNGYLYVYCSNESNIDVFFDNLQVVLTHGPILEETHYYPTGLAMAGISSKAFGKQPNKFHYQSNEIQNQEWYDGTGLEEDDFNARFYDHQLGVWHNHDPAYQFASPFLAMGDNWINGKDPGGKTWWSNLVKSPWTALKVTVGSLFSWNNHKTIGGNLFEIFSRTTWQAPQFVVGSVVGLKMAAFGLVDKVNYFDGLTILTTSIQKDDEAFTLGNITISGSNIRDDPNNQLLQHEYGRYLQSRANGPTYLTYTGVPDRWGPANSGANANLGPTARDANARAFLYFNEKYGSAVTRSWNNAADGSGNYIVGYQTGLSPDDPINIQAVRNNLRSPSFGDWFHAISVVSSVSAALFMIPASPL